MRLIEATIKDAYKIHKTYTEYLGDIGRSYKDEEIYPLWTTRLTDGMHKYVMIMHGRKIIGMVWGKAVTGESKPTFLVEGRFLRRAYRGKYKFSYELVSAVKTITKDFQQVWMILPDPKGKLKGRHRFLGTLVELK